MCINKIRQNIMKNAKGASLNYVDKQGGGGVCQMSTLVNEGGGGVMV